MIRDVEMAIVDHINALIGESASMNDVVFFSHELTRGNGEKRTDGASEASLNCVLTVLIRPGEPHQANESDKEAS
jgi:hypothetical protein